MNPPFFSIITPTYNRANKIELTIQTVLSQTFIDFEYIIVDDGSIDNTKEVVESIKDQRIKYYRKKNGERGAARNFGTGKSSGKYVFFLDSDDSISTQFLHLVHEDLTKGHYPEWYHARFSTIDENGKTLYSKPIIKPSIHQKIKNRNYFASSVFLRKDIAHEYQFIENPAFNFGEDWYLWLRLNERFKLHYSNKINYFQIRESDRSTFNVSDVNDLIINLNLILEHLKKDKKTNYLSLLNKVKAQYYSLIALEYSLRGKSKLALKYLGSCIVLNPTHIFWKKTYSVILKSIT